MYPPLFFYGAGLKKYGRFGRVGETVRYLIEMVDILMRLRWSSWFPFFRMI